MNNDNKKSDVKKVQEQKKPVSLDELVVVLEGDSLRNVIGGGRPKGGKFA